METSRYSENLKKVIAAAEEISRVYNITYIGSEQLLYGMLKVQDCLANIPLSKAGIDVNTYLPVFKRSIDKTFVFRRGRRERT